jgi:hypothetical protein
MARFVGQPENAFWKDFATLASRDQHKRLSAGGQSLSVAIPAINPSPSGPDIARAKQARNQERSPADWWAR